ncbi:MAG: ATP-binding protein [Owenweeksia sp.]
MKENQEEKRLKALAGFDILDTGGEAQFDALTQLAGYICDTPVSLITILSKDRQWFKSKTGTDISETPRDISFCHYAIQEEQAVYEVENTLQDETFKDNPLVLNDPNIRFYAGASLEDDEGNRLGTLCVLDVKPRKLSASQKKALETLAGQVMAQIKLRKYQLSLEGEVSRKTRELNEHIVKLKKAKDRFSEQNLFFRKVIDTTPGFIFVKDYEGVFKLANHALAELYHSSVEEVEGKTDYDFNANKAHVDVFVEKDREVIRSGIPTPDFEEQVTIAGKAKWFKTRKVPMQIGAKSHVLGVSTDITELKELENDLKTRNFELEEFLYNASHDLRGPVSSLLGVADLIKREESMENMRMFGNMVFELSTNLDSTLHRLLEVRRVINKGLNYTELTLSEVLPIWINKNYGAEDISFELDFSKADKLVVDHELFLMVVEKVLSNAAQYHRGEAFPRKVKVHSNLSTSHFHIWVEDNGLGIKEDLLPKVTQMFFKGTADSKGSGLGLYVSSKVMEQLRGKISIHSVPSSGTTVELSFPLNRVVGQA